MDISKKLELISKGNLPKSFKLEKKRELQHLENYNLFLQSLQRFISMPFTELTSLVLSEFSSDGGPAVKDKLTSLEMMAAHLIVKTIRTSDIKSLVWILEQTAGLDDKNMITQEKYNYDKLTSKEYKELQCLIKKCKGQ